MDRNEAATQEGCYFDPTYPNQIIDWIETNCPITSGSQAGECLPIVPWMADTIRAMYGWYRPGGSRLTREAGVWIPKKNGKSWLCSALALFVASHICGGQVVIIASSIKQAGIVFNEAMKMLQIGKQKKHIARNDECWWAIKSKHIIEYRDSNGVVSEIHILPSTKSIGGYHFDLCIMDELAEHKPQWAEEIYQTIKDGGASRNGLLITISTPKFDLAHFAKYKFNVAKEQLEGKKIDITFFPLIYGVADDCVCTCGENHGEGWRCPVEWWKANPGAGITIPNRIGYDRYESVKNNSREEIEWKTLRMGMWCQSNCQWISPAAWNACKDDFSEADLYGCDCICGIDYARKADLAAMVYLFKKDDCFYIVERAWIPEQNAYKKSQTDKVPYELWHKQGHIRFSPGEQIKPEEIRAQLDIDAEPFCVNEVRYDPWGMVETADKIAEDYNTLAVTQNALTMALPTAKLEQLILNKKIKHNGSPLL